jgi:hypothetical protein
MAGRGHLKDVPTLRDPQISMFRNGQWTIAEEPLHIEKPEIAGVGLGMSFAVELLAHLENTHIGLVPCAVGGTMLSQWMPGSELYVNAIKTTQLALSKGTLSGILWHQGEKDSLNSEYAMSYGQRFQKMVTQLRADLFALKVPLIAGELGMFLGNRADTCYYSIVNYQLMKLEQSLSDYACVSSRGLTDNGDKIHFNSESLREFGQRYANKFIKLVNRSEPKYGYKA